MTRNCCFQVKLKISVFSYIKCRLPEDMSNGGLNSLLTSQKSLPVYYVFLDWHLDLTQIKIHEISLSVYVSD